MSGIEPPTREEIRKRLVGPAAGMLLLGGASAAWNLCALALGASSDSGADPAVFVMTCLLIGGLAFTGAFEVIAAIGMLRLRWYYVCVVGSCIFILVPCIVLGIPLGNWSLVVLLNDETKRAFQQPAG